MESVGNRSMWSEGRVGTRFVSSKERSAITIFGSSRLRLKISRVSPIPDLFKNRLSILARETWGKKVFLVYRAFYARIEGRERNVRAERSKRRFATRTIPPRFSKDENIRSNDAHDFVDSFLVFSCVFSIGEKRKVERKKKKERGEIRRWTRRVNRNERGGNSRGFPIVVVIPRPARWPTRFEWESNGRVAGIGKWTRFSVEWPRLFFFLFFPPLLTSQPRSTLINAAGHCARIKGSHPWWDRNAYRNLMPYDATFEYRIVSFRVNFMYIYI